MRQVCPVWSSNDVHKLFAFSLHETYQTHNPLLQKVHKGIPSYFPHFVRHRFVVLLEYYAQTTVRNSSSSLKIVFSCDLRVVLQRGLKQRHRGDTWQTQARICGGLCASSAALDATFAALHLLTAASTQLSLTKFVVCS